MEEPREVRAENCGGCTFGYSYREDDADWPDGCCRRYPRERDKKRQDWCGEWRKAVKEAAPEPEQADTTDPHQWVKARIEEARGILAKFGVEKPEGQNPIAVLFDDYRRLQTENRKPE